MEFYATIAELIPLLMVAIFLESRYASRVKARLASADPLTRRSPLYRVMSAYARVILPWLQIAALFAGIGAELLLIRALAVEQPSDFIRTVAEYSAYLLLLVLAMGLTDLAAAEL